MQKANNKLEIFYICDKEVTSFVYRDLIKYFFNSNKMQANKPAFHKIWNTNWHLICEMSISNTEMQIKQQLRYYVLSTQLTEMKNQWQNAVWMKT